MCDRRNGDSPKVSLPCLPSYCLFRRARFFSSVSRVRFYFTRAGSSSCYALRDGVAISWSGLVWKIPSDTIIFLLIVKRKLLIRTIWIIILIKWYFYFLFLIHSPCPSFTSSIFSFRNHTFVTSFFYIGEEKGRSVSVSWTNSKRSSCEKRLAWKNGKGEKATAAVIELSAGDIRTFRV